MQTPERLLNRCGDCDYTWNSPRGETHANIPDPKFCPDCGSAQVFTNQFTQPKAA